MVQQLVHIHKGTAYFKRRTVAIILFNRLIVIAEKDVVYNKFPIPLINRLEKHFLVMSSGLTKLQEELTRELEDWVEDFASILHQTHEKQRLFQNKIPLNQFASLFFSSVWFCLSLLLLKLSKSSHFPKILQEESDIHLILYRCCYSCPNT